MKRKLAYIAITAALMTSAFFIGKSTVQPETITRETIKEIPQSFESTKIYSPKSESEHVEFMDALEARNGKIIVEVVTGTVVAENGDGRDSCGYYIKYDSTRYHKGDTVQTVFVYNPDTNYIDDIVHREDTLISDGNK